MRCAFLLPHLSRDMFLLSSVSLRFCFVFLFYSFNVLPVGHICLLVANQ